MKHILTLFVVISCSSIFAQEISKETLKAIKYSDTASLDKLVKKENLNNCFEIKNSSYNYLAISIKMGQINSLKYFVEKGADIEKICESKTPLMYAVKYGHLNMVKYLIDKGADLKKETRRGKTALDYAIKYDQTEIAKYLKSKLN